MDGLHLFSSVWRTHQLTNFPQIFYRAKKDGTLTPPSAPIRTVPSSMATDPDVYRTCPFGLEAPLGSLNNENKTNMEGIARAVEIRGRSALYIRPNIRHNESHRGSLEGGTHTLQLLIYIMGFMGFMGFDLVRGKAISGAVTRDLL